MTPVDVLVVVVVVMFIFGFAACVTYALMAGTLGRVLRVSEQARRVLEADVRALRTQRDFAEQELERVSREYQARITALTPRRGPGGRFVK